MRYRELTEAPLDGYELHGDWSDARGHAGPAWSQIPDMSRNSFISKIDRALALDPKTEEKLREVFAKHDVSVYVYLVNDHKMAYFFSNLDWGTIDPKVDKVAWSKFEKDLQKTLKRRAKKKAVQVVLTNNDGGRQRHSLSPWMIIHRIAHGFFGSNPILDNSNPIRDATNEFFVQGRQGYSGSEYQGYKSRQHFLKSICSFKAAREDRMIGDGLTEYVCELFTEYVWKGRIDFRDPPSEIYDDQGNAYPLADADHVRACSDRLKTKLETIFAGVLKRAQGRISVC